MKTAPSPRRFDAFLSHSSKDSKFAEQLAQILRANGLKAWLDQSDLTLCVSPSDASALNGLGSILFYERELDAAEFFQRRALELIKRAGGNYEAAQHDLDMILSFKRQLATPH